MPGTAPDSRKILNMFMVQLNFFSGEQLVLVTTGNHTKVPGHNN